MSVRHIWKMISNYRVYKHVYTCLHLPHKINEDLFQGLRTQHRYKTKSCFLIINDTVAC